MTKDEIIQKTKNFLRQYLGTLELELDQNIFGKGLINSLFSMQLVMFIENTFILQVSTDDLDLSNFNTLNNIANFVEKKQKIKV